MKDVTDIVKKYATAEPEPEEVDFFEMYEKSRLSMRKPVTRAEPVVKIHGIPVCTRKSLSLLSGPSKGGKTAITSILCAGAIKTANGYDGCPLIEVTDNGQQHAVLHIDTEQSESQQYNNLERAIVKRTGRSEEPDYFYTYNTRDYEIKDLRPFVERMFKATFKKHGGIHLAIIDGAADFAASVNDEAEANGLVKFFGQLAAEYNTAIILLLHLNPGSNKERGHLGSQLQRKCESVLTITKENETSLLEAKLLRNGANADFTPLAFQYNSYKGYHTFIDGYRRKDDGRLDEMAQQIFTERRTSAVAVAMITEMEGGSGRNGARTLSRMKELGIVGTAKEGKNTFYALKGYEDLPF
jgi:hypothetical protein